MPWNAHKIRPFCYILLGIFFLRKNTGNIVVLVEIWFQNCSFYLQFINLLFNCHFNLRMWSFIGILHPSHPSHPFNTSSPDPAPFPTSGGSRSHRRCSAPSASGRRHPGTNTTLEPRRIARCFLPGLCRPSAFRPLLVSDRRSVRSWWWFEKRWI